MSKATIRFSFAAALALLVFSFITSSVSAQDSTNKKNYAVIISRQQEKTVQSFLQYAGAIAEGKKEKKTKAFRKNLLDEIQMGKTKIGAMPAFKGDTKYRDSALMFFNVCYSVAIDDYTKIASMKKNAGGSYAKIKTFITAKEWAYKKMQAANQRLDTAAKKFTAQNTNDKEGDKLDRVIAVNRHYDSVFLIFFKSYTQESGLLDAITNKNAKDYGKRKDSLLQDAQNGILLLDSMEKHLSGHGYFKNDSSLIKTCRNVLRLYVTEFEKQDNTIPDYFPQEQDFENQRRAFGGMHTSKEGKAFDKVVEKFNPVLKKFNKAVDAIYDTRKHIADKWSFAVSVFFDRHMPSGY